MSDSADGQAQNEPDGKLPFKALEIDIKLGRGGGRGERGLLEAKVWPFTLDQSLSLSYAKCNSMQLSEEM